jgi:hypothetical protein
MNVQEMNAETPEARRNVRPATLARKFVAFAT